MSILAEANPGRYSSSPNNPPDTKKENHLVGESEEAPPGEVEPFCLPVLHLSNSKGQRKRQKNPKKRHKIHPPLSSHVVIYSFEHLEWKLLP